MKCFDKNINGNRDVKFLECDYLLVQRVHKTHFSKISTSEVGSLKLQSSLMIYLEFSNQSCKLFHWKHLYVKIWISNLLLDAVDKTNNSNTLVCRINVHARLLFWEKNSLARPYFGLHVYCFCRKKSPCTFIFLHLYWYLPCTFINFEKKIPPTWPYLGLHI